MKFYCCHCGLPIGCDDSLAGTEANCPDCQAPLTIPFPIGEAAVPMAAEEEAAAVYEDYHEEAAEPSYRMPPPLVTGPQDAAFEMPAAAPAPEQAPPAPSKRRAKARLTDRISCAFVGLILLLCLLMGVSGLRLTVLSIGNRLRPGENLLGYLAAGVVFTAAASLVMRSYRHNHRRYLRQSLAEYRGAFGFRSKPTEGEAGLLMGAGILFSFLSVISLPFVGSLPVMLLAAVALAMAFDIGQQRKLLKRLRKEQRAAAPHAEAQDDAAPEFPEWAAQEAELAALLEPHPLSPPSRAKWRLRALGLAGAVFVLVLLLVSQPWPHYRWASSVNKVDSYEFFLERFPEGGLAERARAKLRGLQAEETWARAAQQHSLAEARNYLRTYPDGKRCDEARALIAESVDEELRYMADPLPDEAAIDRFLWDYPEASPEALARAEVLLLRRIEVEWRIFAFKSSEVQIRKFLEAHPRAPQKVVADAEALLAKLAAEDSRRLLASSSAQEIRDYLEKHPNSPHRAAVESHLQDLFNDWDWVKVQDSLEHYRRFVSRFPRHPMREWIDKRIIDMEVAEIAAGEHGKLPSTEPQSLGGTEVEIEVKNDTGYALTLRYSGPDSRMLVIPVGKTGKASLLPGEYRVAGSVATANVSNYYGTKTLEGGIYTWNFFIRYEQDDR